MASTFWVDPCGALPSVEVSRQPRTLVVPDAIGISGRIRRNAQASNANLPQVNCIGKRQINRRLDLGRREWLLGPNLALRTGILVLPNDT